MKKIAPYTRKVYYYETDKMAVMHHSNYIRIFEEARSWFMEEAGTAYSEIESRGILAPVLSVDCRYVSPLTYNEEFKVYTKLTKFTGVRFELSYRIVSVKTGKLCAEGSSSHCFTDTDMRPLRVAKKHPDIFDVFTGYLNCETND